MTDFLNYKRRSTNVVYIGDIPLGSEFPVRLQSMTNTDTSDIEGTVNQIIKIVDAGAEYVRITVPSSFVAEKIKPIKEALSEKGYDTPLIADIHFSTKAAEVSARYLEKVRINPGNYADLKQFKHIEYTDKEYNKETEKIKENFVPFLKICKENKTAVRIGTNHGSLSDRILSRYGDTPKGMVESTMEFLRICKEENFNDIVISMKASNPIVMIHATRLLVKTMTDEQMKYPIHLGVTEAGNENEGRIKSAVGIGTLLADGIGDTIRVSLTEAPEIEIPVAKIITSTFNQTELEEFKADKSIRQLDFDPYSYKKRESLPVDILGGNNVPVVITDIQSECNETGIIKSGYVLGKNNKFEKTDLAADYLFVGESDSLNRLNVKTISLKPENKNGNVLISHNEFQPDKNKQIIFLQFTITDFLDFDFKRLSTEENVVIVIDITDSSSPVHAGRNFFFHLEALGIKNPVIIKYKIPEYSETMLIQASAEIGALFIDGFGDGIWIEVKDKNISDVKDLAFGILQACRTRITKTEYISCPSCGRTLFNLEETTAKIKAKTTHLKGVKIGIMGCIVNGPGEMADADFGYVGTGSGKITLYKRQEVIKRNIPEKDAVEELLKLIEQYS